MLRQPSLLLALSVLLDPGVRLHQAEFAGVFGTEEKIQVAVLAGIPVRPSMRPIRPSEIASVFAEDLHRAQLAHLSSRIKNELSAAFRPGGGSLKGGLLLLFLPFQFTACLARK